MADQFSPGAGPPSWFSLLLAGMSWFGINLSLLLAGIIGGIVRLVIRPERSLLRSAGVIFAGGASAVYLTPLAIEHLPAAIERTAAVQNAMGYTVGVAGIALTEGLIELAQRWRRNPTLPVGR